MLRDLYPFSTQDGHAIPLDIIRPGAVFRVPIPISTGSTLLDLVVITPIVVLRATVDCFVRFGTIATLPSLVATDDTLFLPANETIVVAPFYTTLSVIGDGLVGTLNIQLIEQWGGLGKEPIYRR